MLSFVTYLVSRPWDCCAIPINSKFSGEVVKKTKPIPYVVLALLSRSLPAGTQFRGHTVGATPPLPTTARALACIAGRIQHFSPLVHSRRILEFFKRGTSEKVGVFIYPDRGMRLYDSRCNGYTQHAFVARDRNLEGVIGASSVSAGISSFPPTLTLATAIWPSVSGRDAMYSRSLTGA